MIKSTMERNSHPIRRLPLLVWRVQNFKKYVFHFIISKQKTCQHGSCNNMKNICSQISFIKTETCLHYYWTPHKMCFIKKLMCFTFFMKKKKKIWKWQINGRSCFAPSSPRLFPVVSARPAGIGQFRRSITADAKPLSVRHPLMIPRTLLLSGSNRNQMDEFWCFREKVKQETA